MRTSRFVSVFGAHCRNTPATVDASIYVPFIATTPKRNIQTVRNQIEIRTLADELVRTIAARDRAHTWSENRDKSRLMRRFA